MSRSPLSANRFSMTGLPVGLDSGFALFWDFSFPDLHLAPLLQLFRADLTPLGAAFEIPLRASAEPDDPLAYFGLQDVERTREGYALLATAIFTTPEEDGRGLGLYFVDSQGHLLRDRQRVTEDRLGTYLPLVGHGGLSQDGRGNLVVTYARVLDGPDGPTDIYCRRFNSKGEALGPEMLVNTFTKGQQINPDVAAAPDGRFLVAWQSTGQDGSFDGIFGRLFSPEGNPLGPEVLVNEVTYSSQRYPHVTASREGNYFVAWASFHPAGEVLGYELKARFLLRSGVPASAEVHVNQDRLFDQTGGQAAFRGNGTLLTVWDSTSYRVGNGAGSPMTRPYSASPGAEICSIDGASVACDLGRTGGDLELTLAWGGRPGEVTLFGDWDGDGRDDLCAFFRGRFRCDLGHNGAPAEVFETFGLPSDIPLLADVDGDRRADACVRRGRDLLCDTRRDGRVRFQIQFGEGAETPLLGDLDGDGRADLCLVKGSQWRCRLTRSGAERHFTFGRPGDSPALGDADRDGRADPCVLRTGEVLCDLAHDGGEPDFRLELDAPSGAGLLFGNLDGL